MLLLPRKIAAVSLILLGSLILISCGFKPLHGENGVSSSIFQRIEIASVPERSGQILRNKLINRFYKEGYPSDPSFNLRIINLTQTETRLGITDEDNVTKAQLTVRAHYTLINTKNGQPVIEPRSIRSIVSYNILDSQFASVVAEQDALERGLEDLAQTIETDLALHFQRNNAAP